MTWNVHNRYKTANRRQKVGDKESGASIELDEGDAEVGEELLAEVSLLS
jgi:hypothetical protein